jgi:hypothetical protein
MNVIKHKGSRVLSAYGDIPVLCANCRCPETTVEIAISIIMINLCDDCAMKLQHQIHSIVYLDYYI